MIRKAAAGLIVLLAACTTRKDMASKPGDSGVKATYAVPFDKVKRAALDALGELSFSLKEEKWSDEYRYMILSSQGLSTGTTGRYARVMIEKGDKECIVYVLVEAKAASQDTRGIDDTIAADLQKKIAGRLK